MDCTSADTHKNLVLDGKGHPQLPGAGYASGSNLHLIRQTVMAASRGSACRHTYALDDKRKGVNLRRSRQMRLRRKQVGSGLAPDITPSPSRNQTTPISRNSSHPDFFG
jgi:hypothetical protein